MERYGHFSLAAESMYDHPFQWGSKRIGPDLARVGGKYSSDWHYAHLINPQSVVPESLMPHYAFLADTPLETDDIAARLRALRMVGVPYTDDEIANAATDLAAQADPVGGQRRPAEALSEGGDGAGQRHVSRPNSMRWWRICRSSARWSISPIPPTNVCNNDSLHDPHHVAAAQLDRAVVRRVRADRAHHLLAGTQVPIERHGRIPLEDDR